MTMPAAAALELFLDLKEARRLTQEARALLARRASHLEGALYGVDTGDPLNVQADVQSLLAVAETEYLLPALETLDSLSRRPELLEALSWRPAVRVIVEGLLGWEAVARSYCEAAEDTLPPSIQEGLDGVLAAIHPQMASLQTMKSAARDVLPAAESLRSSRPRAPISLCPPLRDEEK